MPRRLKPFALLAGIVAAFYLALNLIPTDQGIEPGAATPPTTAPTAAIDSGFLTTARNAESTNDPLARDGVIDVMHQESGVGGQWSGIRAEKIPEIPTRENWLRQLDRSVGNAFISYAVANGFTRDVIRDANAKGNGTTNDTAAFQRAADALVSTGGVIFAPPNHKYVVGSGSTGLLIKSRLPIWIVSDMEGSGYGGTQITAGTAKACLVPAAGFTGSMITYDFVTAETNLANTGGGGIRGIRFVDWNGATYRNVTGLVAAVYAKTACYFRIEDCDFVGVAGSAVKVGQAVIGRIDNCKAYRCGATGEPTIDIGDATNFAGVYSRDCFLEQCTGDYTVHVRANAGGNFTNLYIENGEQVFSPDPVAIQGDGAVGIHGGSISNIKKCLVLNAQKNQIDGVSLYSQSGATVMVEIGSSAYFTTMTNCKLFGSAGQTGDCITAGAPWCTFDHLVCDVTGRLNFTASDIVASNILMYIPAISSGYAIDTGNAGSLTGAVIDGGTSMAQKAIRVGSNAVASNCVVHRLNNVTAFTGTSSSSSFNGCKAFSNNGGTAFDNQGGTLIGCSGDDSGETWKTRQYAYVFLPLSGFREVDGNIDVGNAAANGGVLASDTTPILRGASSGDQEIVWAAANTDFIAQSFAIPPDMDTTQDVQFSFFVYTDNAGGGGIDAAGNGIITMWDGGAQKLDTGSDGTPATSLHTVTDTVAAADVASAVRTCTLVYQPQAHANDPTILTGVRMRYVRKVPQNL